MTMPETELLYRAAGTPLGISVLLSDPGEFRAAVQRLYRARREAADPILAGLQFRSGPTPDRIWIVCGGAKRLEVLDGPTA